MAKPVGALCNLGCEYCYYLEKTSLLDQANSPLMSDEVLESYIRQYIAASPYDSVEFSWQGGEPTLAGLPFFQKAVLCQKQYSGGKRISNNLQTNGTQINTEWAEFLAENKFLVGFSIDGPEHLHNTHRVNKAGVGAFADAMKGLEQLLKHKVDVNALTVVSRSNSSAPLEVYQFLKSIGLSFMQFIPLVERFTTIGSLANPVSEEVSTVTPWSVVPDHYGTFLVSIFDEWVHNDVGHIFVQIFDVALNAWMGYEPPLCWFATRCGNALVLEYDGGLFSCDHFVYPEYHLGHIGSDDLVPLAVSEKQQAFGDAKAILPQYCQKCNVRFACNGECPKRRFANAPTGEPGLNYLCPAYKRFFRHIDPYMKRMAKHLRAGRAPAEIMSDLAKGRSI